MTRKLKKTLFITAGTVVILAILIIAFISPFSKYIVEKYDEKYTGRQITLDWIYVNPFAGYIYVNDCKIYEAGSDSVFFSADGVTVDFSILKLLSGTYEISDFTLTRPFAKIIQNRQDFNFDDLLEKFAAKAPDTSKKPVHFNILDVKIKDGEFHYAEKEIPVNYFIEKVNFESPGMRWNSDTIPGKFSLVSGPGNGTMKGNFVFNFKKSDYQVDLIVNEFDMTIINEYLKGLANYGQIAALMDADIKASGNLKDKLAINLAGKIWLNDFHFGKNSEEDYTSFERLVMTIDELNPKENKYHFDSVLLFHPYFKYERYDSLDNVQNMFGARGSKYKSAKEDTARFNLILEIAEYVRLLSAHFFDSHYKINMLAIEKAEIYFNDYSLHEKFSAGLQPLAILADSIDKNRSSMQISYQASIKPYGSASVFLTMNPRDYYDFDMSYRVRDIPAAMFNPYMVTYSSFPLDKGTMEFTGKWEVEDGIIQSENHLIVIDPRLTKRVRKKDTKWLPAPLAMAFIRERGNVIDYEIPVEGNLKDPSFRLRDVLGDLVKNIFIKPPTSPYGFQVKKAETEIENFHSLKWPTGQAAFNNNQERFVKKIASFLEDNPEASVSVQPVNYEEKEKEHILLFEAKKKFYLAVNNDRDFDEVDSLKVDKMSSKDASFNRFLKKQVKDTLLFTVQEKCRNMLGSGIVNTKYHQLLKQREKKFSSYFDKNTLEQIKFLAGESTVPYNGFSFFKIDYHGDIPERLRDSYEEMNELEEEDFRQRYKEIRKSPEELMYTEKQP